jgi:hypothetical protein
VLKRCGLAPCMCKELDLCETKAHQLSVKRLCGHGKVYLGLTVRCYRQVAGAEAGREFGCRFIACCKFDLALLCAIAVRFHKPFHPHCASFSQIVNTWSEAELGRIIRDWGEEKLWRQVKQQQSNRGRSGCNCMVQSVRLYGFSCLFVLDLKYHCTHSLA